ncbi:MAG TPA: condensation domain-containing protein [Anaerolineales bacterium]|nr:condensation domain-containing protein [Anaerolineales bacterium]
MFKKEITGVPRMQLRQPNANVVLYGVFETTVSKDVLEKTILFLSDKHTLLNCHVKTDGENKVWYVTDKKLLPEVNTPKSKNINELLINELKHRFDLDKGPLIRFTLLNQTETTLIINCHHAICDGMSLIYLFKDIMRILSGKDIKIEQKMPVFLEPENIPQRVGTPISRFFISLTNKKWSKEPISFSNQLYQEVHTDFWKECKPQIISFKFSKEETANIVSQCKHHHVSVNSGLVTAFLYAEKQLFGQKDYSSKVLVTTNLRTHLKNQPGESMGYFISTVRPNLEYSEKKTFWENAQIFHNKIKRLLEKDLFKSQLISLFTPNFLDVMMLNFFGQREDKLAKRMIKKSGMDKINSTFTIANLGRIEIADNLEMLKIKTLFGPMAISNAMEKYIGVLTINDELHFSICFNENNVNQESILKIIKLIPQIFDDRPRL